MDEIKEAENRAKEAEYDLRIIKAMKEICYSRKCDCFDCPIAEICLDKEELKLNPIIIEMLRENNV